MMKDAPLISFSVESLFEKQTIRFEATALGFDKQLL